MQNRGNSFLDNMPPVTLNLLIINVVVFVAQLVMPRIGIELEDYFGLHYWQSESFNIIQLFTNMFLHADFSHLFFNMFSLFIFSGILERVFGQKRFLTYFIFCGLGASIVQELVWTFTWRDNFVPELASLNHISVAEMSAYIDSMIAKGEELPFLSQLVSIGASGAVFGILLAFGMLFPNVEMFLMFIPIPIKAKWMVIGYGIIELMFGVAGTMDNIGHFAHLGGMLFGFILLYYWKKKGLFNRGHF